MSRYRKVAVRLWTDAKFRSLSQDAKLLWFYLLTGPQTSNIPGIVVGGQASIAEALQWLPERFAERFAELFHRGLCKADFEAGLVWLPNGPKHNPPANPNQVKAWLKVWDEVPECQLKHEVWHVLKPFMERFSQPLPEPFVEPLPERYAKPKAEAEAEVKAEESTAIAPPGTSSPPVQPPLPLGAAREDQSKNDSPPKTSGSRRRGSPKAPSKPLPHAEEVRGLWETQEQLRLELPGTRRLTPSASRLKRISERLTECMAGEGATLADAVEDCKHVLRVYAAEAKAKPDSAKWFNGETNWRQRNFEMALGRPAPSDGERYVSTKGSF